jgi:uncharacterized C2H2 Zn-finger protein
MKTTPLTCRWCSTTFVGLRRFNEHTASAHPGKCHWCDQTFRSQGGVRKHVRSDHPWADHEGKRVRCKVCYAFFLDLRTLIVCINLEREFSKHRLELPILPQWFGHPFILNYGQNRSLYKYTWYRTTYKSIYLQ